MARFLLARADEPLVTINQAALDQSTPLHAVCIRGHADLVDWMLTKGADVFAEDHCKRTPLAFAARLGFPRIVTALVAAGSDRCSIDRDGRSVLYKAAWGGSAPCVHTLLGAGVDPVSLSQSEFLLRNTRQERSPWGRVEREESSFTTLQRWTPRGGRHYRYGLGG